MSIIQGGGFKFSVCSTGGYWKWDVVNNNIPNLGQKYYISNIETPFGPLYRNMIPIPGDVLISMHESLNQFMTQLSPEISILSSLNYSLTVTENDPITDVASLIFSNVGALGSYMNINATPNSSWLVSTPSFINGIDKNQQVSFDTSIKPFLMVYTSSPYTGVINYQDNDSPSNVIPVVFTITVLPRPTITVSSPTLSMTFYLSSRTSTPVSLTVTNSGPATSILNFEVSKTQDISPWLVYNPTNGSGVPSSGNVNILFTVNPANAPFITGVFPETIRIQSTNSTNGPIDIPYTLNVVP